MLSARTIWVITIGVLIAGCTDAGTPKESPSPGPPPQEPAPVWTNHTTVDDIVINIDNSNFGDNCFAVKAKRDLHYRNVTAELAWNANPAVPELELVYWGSASTPEVRESGPTPLMLEYEGPEERPGSRVAFWISAQRTFGSVPVMTDATLTLTFEYETPNEITVLTESACEI